MKRIGICFAISFAALFLIVNAAYAQIITTGQTRAAIMKTLGTAHYIQDNSTIRIDSFAFGGFYGRLHISFNSSAIADFISWTGRADTAIRSSQFDLLKKELVDGTMRDGQTSWTYGGRTSHSTWRLNFNKSSGALSYVDAQLE